MWAKAVRCTLFLISTVLFLGVLLDLSDPVVSPPGLINYRFRIHRPYHQQILAAFSKSYLWLPGGQTPLEHENNGPPVHNDDSSSTRDCVISRTPGQRMLFEQTLLDFKRLHPGSIPILILVPVSGTATVLADMTSQLIQFTKMLGHGRVLVSFGITEEHDDNIDSQIGRTSEALFNSKVLHNLRFTKDLDDWTARSLEGYLADFEVAVVLRGVICAADLVRLVIHTIENNADMACSVDITFSPRHRVTTSPGNINFATGKPIPTEDLIRAQRFVQAQCCDGSVKVIRLRSAYSEGFSGEPCGQRSIRSDEAASFAETTEKQQSQARIMISPSVKSSPDPHDFRSAVQLGFMDLQGFDYRPVVWEE